MTSDEIKYIERLIDLKIGMHDYMLRPDSNYTEVSKIEDELEDTRRALHDL